MINILHLYYDLLNLYGENANTRCLVNNLKRNNIKVNVDLLSIKDKVDFAKYDIIYISCGDEEAIEIALKDILRFKDELKKYTDNDKYLILTGNAMTLFGKYILTNEKKLNALNIFNYYTEYITTSKFKNASTDRIVGEVMATTKLIKEKVVGFQNRCDYIYNVKTPLFKTSNKFSNSGKDNNEGFVYKNVYATHTIGPLLIRNPYFTDYLLNKLCESKKLKYKVVEDTAKKAYKKYLNID
jgi:CobQ-like glutamine amidotransferase family enzyme